MTNSNNSKTPITQELDYANQLVKKQMAWWKRFFNVQAPYRWNLKRLEPGLTLDIGCGIGRNLINLRGNGVGVDHNLQSVQIARRRGLTAFTQEEFKSSHFNTPRRFDTFLLSHVAEHMHQQKVADLLAGYLYLLKPKGKLIIITPQEAGYRSDSTHIEFMDFAKLRNIAAQLGFTVLKEYSFPFPQLFGHLFIYNEFISVSMICR